MKNILVETIGLKKSFRVGEQDVPVLKGVDMKIARGEFVVLFGPSGCGKSTLLHTVLGLEKPTAGQVLIDGKDYYAWDADTRANYRKKNISTVFQQPLWIRALDVVSNVAFPLLLSGSDKQVARQEAIKMLTLMGMDNWALYLPTELSAGQQQKVSLARALVTDPVLLATDEPTGNLDTSSGWELMDTLAGLSNHGKTIFMITHDLEYLKYADRLLHMVDGLIVEMVDQRHDGVKKGINGKKLVSETNQATVRDKDFLTKFESENETKNK